MDDSDDSFYNSYSSPPRRHRIAHSPRHHLGNSRGRLAGHSRSSRGGFDLDRHTGSPDPVKLVEQFNKDEELARQLQSEFDTENIPRSISNCSGHHRSHPSLRRQEFAFSSDDDDEFIHPRERISSDNDGATDSPPRRRPRCSNSISPRARAVMARRVGASDFNSRSARSSSNSANHHHAGHRAPPNHRHRTASTNHNPFATQMNGFVQSVGALHNFFNHSHRLSNQSPAHSMNTLAYPWTGQGLPASPHIQVDTDDDEDYQQGARVPIPSPRIVMPHTNRAINFNRVPRRNSPRENAAAAASRREAYNNMTLTPIHHRSASRSSSRPRNTLVTASYNRPQTAGGARPRTGSSSSYNVEMSNGRININLINGGENVSVNWNVGDRDDNLEDDSESEESDRSEEEEPEIDSDLDDDEDADGNDVYFNFLGGDYGNGVRGAGAIALGRLQHTPPQDLAYEMFNELADALGDAVPRGLKQSAIDRLPTKLWKPKDKPSATVAAGDGGSSPLTNECNVCMCSYEFNDELRILNCFHEFHSKCIDKWLKRQASCPICRVKVSVDG